MTCIDTHIHIWDFRRAAYSWLEGNTSVLNRNYIIDELTPQALEAGVTEGVLIQAANTEEETAYMLEVAETTQWLKGVVGWLPLLQPKKVKTILDEGYGAHSLFKGVRHLIHDESDPRWLLQEPVLESLRLLAERGVPYDLVGVVPRHLETLLEVLDGVPRLAVVLDHLSQPPVKAKERFGRWGDLIKELSQHPTVYAKISGLGLTAGKGSAWAGDDIKPYVEFALTHFGTDRCFCGGDWPVSLLAGAYTHTWTIYRQTLASLLTGYGQQQVLAGNAKRFYALE